jgi:uncharacterized membrane protein YbhN (UPF0104 family)
VTSETLEAEQARPQSRWRYLFRLAPPVIIIGLLWSLADGPSALERLAEADWRYLVLAFIAVNLQTIASAWRWNRVAARLDQAIPLRRAIPEYYLSQLVNQSLPGGVLGDAARAVRARHEAGLGIAAKAVIIERLAGQISMFGLLATAGTWAILTPSGLTLPVNQNQLLIGVFAILVLALVIYLGLRFIRKKWSARLGQSIKIALFDKGAWVGQSLLSAAIVVLNLASFTLCALATGTILGLEAVLVLVPLILCAMLVPTTVAGWGFREGAAAGLFPLVGATAAGGFAASLAFGLVILAASLPGLLVLIRPGKNRRPS